MNIWIYTPNYICYTCHVLGYVSIFRLLYYNPNQNPNLNPNPNPNPKSIPNRILNPNPNLKPSPNPSPILTLILILRI